MPNYRSLLGGIFFFSAAPNDWSVPVSIRFNNPGALNVAGWIKSFPGYVSDSETTTGNRTVVFEAPEQGVAAWWELLRKYREHGVVTVGGIINRYGGGQNYSAYAKQVCQWSGLHAESEIKLYGDDATLLCFARAMFRYEAGKITPWHDEQLLHGFELGRRLRANSIGEVKQPEPEPPQRTPQQKSLLQQIIDFIIALLSLRPLPKRPAPLPEPIIRTVRILRKGNTGNDVRQLQQRLIEIGYVDLVVDGIFGEVTERAVRKFQTARNLDPDGEVGPLTLDELNRMDAAQIRPPLMPPSSAKYSKPKWYAEAEKYIGFRETGVNRGIEQFLRSAKVGQLGDPWCAIFVNAMLADAGTAGSGSAAARSFERSPNFVKLSGPALGAIVTMWRSSPSSGLGHVFLYSGENSQGVRGIGANEDDQVKQSIHERSRITGYYWPKGETLPEIRPVAIGETGVTTSKET